MYQHISNNVKKHEHFIHTMAYRAEFARSSRASINSSTSIRCIRTKSGSIETFLRWSLTRDMLRSASEMPFIVFTVVQEAVHVTLTQVIDENMETHQWIFEPQTTLEEVKTALCLHFTPSISCSLFIPGRASLQQLAENHLGRSLNLEMLRTIFPKAGIVRLDSFTQISRRIMPRIIGSDARHWLKQVMMASPIRDVRETAANEFLTTAVRTDSAMILRLLVTPATTWLRHKA